MNTATTKQKAVHVTFRITESLGERLSEMSDVMGIPKSVIARIALESILDELEDSDEPEQHSNPEL